MVKKMTLTDLSPVTNLEVFRWLLSGPDGEKLSKLGEAAYEMVLKRVPTKTTGLADAMDMMVAAATSAKAAKDSKKSAASVVKASLAHAKKKRKKA